MKSKNYLYLKIKFLFLILISTSVFSQQEEFCATPPSTIPDPPGVYSKSADPAILQNFPSISFDIFFWRINKSDGSYTSPGWPITLEKVKRSVDSLNHYFAPMKICFNLVGMDTINNTTLHSGASFNQIKNYAVTNGYEREGAFNIYAPDSLARGSGATDYLETKVAIISAVVGEKYRTLYHEIGHCLKLIHTFGNSNERPHPTNCEHVTRNPNDTNYNADQDGIGDEVKDTNAVPNFQREQTNHFAYAVHDAGLVSSWSIGRQMSLRENGFDDLPDAGAIAQALQDYGFKQSEINYLRHNPAILDAYYDVENAVYTPDDRILQPQSPFFKDCQGTPYQITSNDIKNIMSYSSSEKGYLFTTGQAIRIHETIRGNMSIFGPIMSDKDIDLFIKDIEEDIGQEPNIHAEIFWNSPDIWVRNQNDGEINTQHQNPVFYTNKPNFVYVRISNKGCSTSSGNDQIKLYWGKANTVLTWDDYWVGNVSINDIPMGGELGTLTIPPIAPGTSEIIEFPWLVPDPMDYYDISFNPWHFALLARIVSDDDPMTFPEGIFVKDNVRNNNNIAMKNTSVIRVYPQVLSENVGAVVGISNPSSTAKSYSLHLNSEENVTNNIYEDAEIGIKMDSILFEAWKRGDKSSYNVSHTSDKNKVIITNNNAILDNIQLEPNEYGTAYITFNFLTQNYNNNQKYIYQIIQKDKSTNRVLGGETFEIYKEPRIPFYAYAGDDQEIEKNQNLILNAMNINEDAEYNWYDSDGHHIHSGMTVTVSPNTTEEYQLEVISISDGFKDYDNILVSVKPNRIISISPNPTSDQVIINYTAENVTSAYIMILNQSTGVSDNYILDISLNEIIIDLTSKPYGLYSAVLICDGEIQDVKNLGKN